LDQNYLFKQAKGRSQKPRPFTTEDFRSPGTIILLQFYC